jgi:hypothetical protein
MVCSQVEHGVEPLKVSLNKMIIWHKILGFGMFELGEYIYKF